MQLKCKFALHFRWFFIYKAVYFLQNLQLLQINYAFISERPSFTCKVLLSMREEWMARIETISKLKRITKKNNYCPEFDKNYKEILTHVCVIHRTWTGRKPDPVKTQEFITLSAEKVAIESSRKFNILGVLFQMELPFSTAQKIFVKCCITILTNMYSRTSTYWSISKKSF